ncbi:MAG: FliH/SctL family protein [Bryobacteraceae bacterium]
MSSRILRRGEAGQAAPVNWNLIPSTEGDGEPHIYQQPGAAPQVVEPPPTPPAPPPGPPLEEYLRLEKSLRAIEQSLPERERRAQQKGREEGESAATAKWQAAMENATRAVAALGSLRSRIRREAEQDVIRLATAMARRILRRELSIDPEAICGLLRTAFERLDMRETSRIRVRPEDREAVGAYLGRIGSPQRIEVIADPALERGALLLDCDRGQLDASVETQLEEIERGFADLLERRKEA